jgi:AcrR family transcriptional regulator
MGIKERKERQKDALRTRILDAARELFAKEGYDAVSMRKIADAIEYSPTAIYQYFVDKRELMDELVRADFASLGENFSVLLSIEDPVERIRAAGHAYIQFATNYPNHFRLMFMTPDTHPADMTPADIADKGRADEDGYAILVNAVAEAAAAGRFRPEYGNDVELISQTFWAAVHGVASLYVAKHDDPCIAWAPFERRCQVMVDGIIRGLVNDNDPAREGGRS